MTSLWKPFIASRERTFKWWRSSATSLTASICHLHMFLSFETGTFFKFFSGSGHGSDGLVRSNRKPVVSIQVDSIQTQGVKLHKNFVHFKCSLRVNKKNILAEYLRSLIKPSTGNYLHLDWINLYPKDLYRNDQYSMNVANAVMAAST